MPLNVRGTSSASARSSCLSMDVLVHWNEVRLGFVSAEYDLALTFASIALGCDIHSERYRQNERLARTAYHAAVRFSVGLLLAADEAEQLAIKRCQVESALRQLDVSG